MLGPFPPPVHGMANVNLAVRELLTRHDAAPPTILNTAYTSIRRTPASVLLKTWRVFASLVVFLAMLLRRRTLCLYVSVSGGPGQLSELPFICLARLAGTNLRLHHHSFAYLNRRSPLTAAYCALAGRRAVHFVLCERMAELLRAHYGRHLTTTVISNAAFSRGNGTHTAPRSGIATIGYLSNVSEEKGIKEFIRVATELAAQDAGVRFAVAGPCVDQDTHTMVLQAADRLDNLEYLGPVYGANKEEFLTTVDVLLFPTYYRNEAEPLTILEALAHCAPVIAMDRGCIAEQLRGGSGLVVPQGDDFVDRAVNQLLKWIASPREYALASRESRRAFEELRNTNEVSLQHFLKLVANP